MGRVTKRDEPERVGRTHETSHRREWDLGIQHLADVRGEEIGDFVL